VEQLEDRMLPSTFYAATVGDLIADIRAANASGGLNSIVLTAPPTSPYVLTAVDNSTDGPTGLPVTAANDNLTIVGNGDTIQRSTAAGTPYFRLLDVASGGSLTLQNLTVQNGVADGTATRPAAFGGGIYNQGSLILSAVTVQNNYAQGVDGIYTYTAFPELPGFRGYGGWAFGGGIASYGALTIQNGSLIQGNSATGGDGFGFWDSNAGSGGSALGGGVYVGGGAADLTGITLSGNTAQGGKGASSVDAMFASGDGGNAYGGGLCVTGGTVVNLSGSTVSSNQALGGLPDTPSFGGAAYGGGIYLERATVSLRNDTVQNNAARTIFAGSFGGGLYIYADGVGPSTVYLDTFTVAHTINNTAEVDPNIGGFGWPYTLLN
jgi:hypothetical protein